MAGRIIQTFLAFQTRYPPCFFPRRICIHFSFYSVSPVTVGLCHPTFHHNHKPLILPSASSPETSHFREMDGLCSVTSIVRPVTDCCFCVCHFLHPSTKGDHSYCSHRSHSPRLAHRPLWMSTIYWGYRTRYQISSLSNRLRFPRTQACFVRHQDITPTREQHNTPCDH